MAKTVVKLPNVRVITRKVIHCLWFFALADRICRIKGFLLENKRTQISRLVILKKVNTCLSKRGSKALHTRTDMLVLKFM